jgi:hypothetical protein
MRFREGDQGTNTGLRSRNQYVSHLWCSEFLLPSFPALTGWATLCRASSAPALPRSDRNPPMVTRGLYLATRG